MPIYVFTCEKCQRRSHEYRCIDERNAAGDCAAAGCDGTTSRAGVEASHFYLRADGTPAGGGGRRGWSNPGMSGIDYKRPSRVDGDGYSTATGTHLTRGY